MASNYLTCAETAKLLRKALKQAHPGVKFSVRSDVYAGGASIRVVWTDGPFEAEVAKTTGLYNGATFDGMIDLKSHHESILVDDDGNARLVHFGADFIFTNRKISDAYRTQIEQVVADATGEPFDQEREYAFPMRWDGDMEHLRIAMSGHWTTGRDMVHRLSFAIAPQQAVTA